MNNIEHHMSRIVRKLTFGNVRQAKIKMILRIRAVWSESSLAIFCKAKDAQFLYADKEDSVNTTRM